MRQIYRLRFRPLSKHKSYYYHSWNHTASAHILCNSKHSCITSCFSKPRELQIVHQVVSLVGFETPPLRTQCFIKKVQKYQNLSRNQMHIKLQLRVSLKLKTHVQRHSHESNAWTKLNLTLHADVKLAVCFTHLRTAINWAIWRHTTIIPIWICSNTLRRENHLPPARKSNSRWERQSCLATGLLETGSSSHFSFCFRFEI